MNDQPLETAATTTLSPERWLPVPGYEGLYEVSDRGRVRSLDRLVPYWRGGFARKRGKVLKQKPGSNGYPKVALLADSKREDCSVHRLVLLAFIGEPADGQHGAHYNGVRDDNRLENLRWDTPKGNHADRTRHGTNPAGERNVAAVLTEELVLEIRALYDGQNGAALAELYGVSRHTLTKAATGRSWGYLPAPPKTKRPALYSRRARGEGNGNAVLTAESVRQIRAAYNGRNSETLADLFGVARTTISAIVTGKSWGWVTAEDGWQPLGGGVAKGERNGRAILTAADVQFIRANYRWGEGVRLAERFGVSKAVISKIVKGQSWRSVPPVLVAS